MAGSERSLEATPTWAVAVICFVLVSISFIIEQAIHHAGSWLKKKRKQPLYEALEKLKSELMLVGFISLLLTVVQYSVAKICIPTSVAHSWHPCKRSENDDTYDDPCLAKGKVQFVSTDGLHQLHIFIFVLAFSHIIYCLVTFGLGKCKMKRWKSWEDETKTVQYQFYNDPERFRFARDTSFGRRHLHFWSQSPVLLWIVCFFRQFFRSVARVDYLTLRHGFITEHLPPQSQASFNFQKYIDRALEEDFKVIVGISPVLWFCAVLFLLTNTNGWYSHFWLPFIPLIIILIVGAKLQMIITKMGIRILEKGDVIMGSPVVQPSDDLFWFRRPGFILFLIHFVSFENAFQLAFFGWSWYEYGYPSCFHENLEDLLIRVSMGVLIQVLCSYVTLPLYALVTQMGSKMKPVIFGDQVATALQGWQQTAKKNTKQGRRSSGATPLSSRPTSPVNVQASPPRASNFSNEGTSASPGHDDFSRKDQLFADSFIEISERDIEKPPEQVSSDFSFIKKESG